MGINEIGENMKIKEYEEFVVSNSREALTDVNYSFIGLAGEVGECLEWYKKAVLRGNKAGIWSPKDLKLELSDVLFYLTRIAKFHNWTLKDIMTANVDKLTERRKSDIVTSKENK